MLSHISLFLDELSGKLDLSSEEKTSDEKLKDKEVLSDEALEEEEEDDEEPSVLTGSNEAAEVEEDDEWADTLTGSDMFNKEAISGEENTTDVLAVSGREEADEIAS